MTAVLLLAAALSSRWIGGVWNPEDMVRLPGTRWAVVSAMRSTTRPGCLRLIDTANAGRPGVTLPAPGPEPAVFAPHGLGVRRLAKGRFELLVVDHGGGEWIDHFVVDARPTPRVVAFKRIPMPAGTSGNGVAPLRHGGFVTTSMFDPRDPATLARFARARPTGGVWRWRASTGWRPFGPRMSGANGIALSADDRFAYVSEWAARRIWRIALDGSQSTAMHTTFLPDNLRWGRGRLLVAGQIGRPEQVYACEMRHLQCPMGYRVASVDPQRWRIATRLSVSDKAARRDGFGGATGALLIDRSLWITSFKGDKILRWRP